VRGMLAARTLLRSRNARWQLRSLHSQRTTVGLVGAGNMGRGMAASLARAGLPVAQFDRDAAALAASAAASPLIESVGR
jgi:phosphoglycerate dehydrogenase-like enzyme